MVNTLYIGVDLSTRMTGVCFLIKDGENVKTVYFNLINNTGFNISKMNEYRLNFQTHIINQIHLITKNHFDEFPKIKIGIEISNIKHPGLALKFNFLGGMLTGLFFESLKPEFLEIKTFNANEWFQFLAQKLNLENWTHMQRPERKKTNMEFVSQMLNKFIDNDDKADAFSIAYFWNQCQDTSERYDFTQKNRIFYTKKQTSKTKQIQKINKEINSLLNKINEIKIRKQTSKILDKTKIKLSEMEENLKELQSKKKEIQNAKAKDKF